jgi:hypothetical protein
MTLELIPLLQKQREIYNLPIGFERFRSYIQAMADPNGEGLALPPLVAMNPMGKPHIAALLDQLLALGAEPIAAEAVAEAATRLAPLPRALRVGLVVSDDLLGGWTNRYLSEASLRLDGSYAVRHGWATVPLWTSEEWEAEAIRAATLAAIYRTCYMGRFGKPQTLEQILAQEGLVGRFAAMSAPRLDPDDLAYTREVLAAYRRASDFPVVFACLYGDEAARSVGYPPVGLSPRAGFALALAEAYERSLSPEQALAR